MNSSKADLLENAVKWLSEIIQIPSFSKEEDQTAQWFFDCLENQGAKPFRSGNNVWAISSVWDPNKPTLLLNSHHDTVKPVSGWTFSPFEATRVDDNIFGLFVSSELKYAAPILLLSLSYAVTFKLS